MKSRFTTYHSFRAPLGALAMTQPDSNAADSISSAPSAEWCFSILQTFLKLTPVIVDPNEHVY